MTAYEKVIAEINVNLNDGTFKQDITQALLCPETKDEEIANLLSIFWVSRLIDLELLKKCIEYYSQKQNIIHLWEPIGEIARSLHNETPKELEQYAFELVISTNGYERFMGRHLWDEFNMDSSDFNILSNSEEVQLRFAVSIVQDYMFPQKRLKKLLMLFNSPYEYVRKTLVKHSLSHYSLNYFGSVKKTFDEQSFLESDELKLFQSFLESFEKQFKMSRECKELHSEYLFPAEYEICLRESSEHLRERTRMASENNKPSFLDYISTVELGRGGGWRNEDGTVNPLGKITYSQEIPMMIHSFSPLEERDITNWMFKDWSKLGTNDET